MYKQSHENAIDASPEGQGSLLRALRSPSRLNDHLYGAGEPAGACEVLFADNNANQIALHHGSGKHPAGHDQAGDEGSAHRNFRRAE